MKTGCGKILALAITAMLLAFVLPCRAAEEGEENIWSEDTPQWRHREFELTEEKIEHIMNRISETDPAKAEELKKLQEEDPEKFKVELRNAMREQIDKKIKEHIENRRRGHTEQPGEQTGPEGMPPKAGMRKHGEPFGPGHIMPEMGRRWKYDKYIDWMQENYPQEAEKLAKLKEDDPNLYWKQFGLGLKKYGRIAEAARENPQLAEVLKKDLTLRQEQEKLLGEIKTAGDEEKEELVKELQEVVNNRFDVIVERKQIEYEQLLEKLERLKNDVEQRKAKMEKWKDAEFKEESVKERIKELLGENEKFTWQ